MQVGTNAEIRIADNGPGLPENGLQTMLQPFERGQVSKALRGNGLGLAIAQAIVHFHGGDIRLINNSPGLTVAIQLPMA